MSFFLRNSNAADNLEGVARWRLLEETVHQSVEETERAVRWLVAKGFLREVATTAAGSIFMINPDMREQAERYLAEGQPPRKGERG